MAVQSKAAADAEARVRALTAQLAEAHAAAARARSEVTDLGAALQDMRAKAAKADELEEMQVRLCGYAN